MEVRRREMPLLRLAYSTQFLIALIAGAGAAFAAVKATAAAVSQDHPWGGPTLKWFGIVLALLVGCGMASYYYHVYGESDESDQPDSQTSWLAPGPAPQRCIGAGFRVTVPLS
jgi:hypothetical protein